MLALQAEYSGRPQRINEVRALAPPGLDRRCVRRPSLCPPPWSRARVQLRIGGVIRRDRDQEHPAFPGVVAYPASLVAKELEGIACGQQRGQVVRLNLDGR